MIRYEEDVKDSDKLGHLLLVESVLHRERTGFQDLEVMETVGFGRAMALDGVVQTTVGDGYIYHEMIVHPAMLEHGSAKSVLIIGGGDGGTLREVLRHPVERVVMVELDEAVPRVCRDLMPEICGNAFNDPRATLIIGDGAAYVRDSTESFDVIVVDSTDNFGPGAVLFADPFYAACRARLGDRGIFVSQNGVAFAHTASIAQALSGLRGHFPVVRPFLAPVPTYAGGPTVFALASVAAAAPEATVAERWADLRLETSFFTPEVWTAARVLPPVLRQAFC